VITRDARDRSGCTTCCPDGADMYPWPCPHHGDQVPPDLLRLDAGHGVTCEHADRGSGPREIRVLVVDDHPAVRAAVVERLGEEDDLTVVGECENGSEVVAAAARLRPDVVVMDLAMPVMDGVAATQALRSSHIHPRVVVHTGSGAQARPQAAGAGADAVVPKAPRLDELLSCIRAVVDGCGCCPYCL